LEKHFQQIEVHGGPNGSGKTTFVNRVLETRQIEYLGADAIAAEISPEKPETVAVAAGREFLRRLRDRIENRVSIVVESTLAGKSLVKYIEAATKNGFETALNFVFLDSVNANIVRVTHRVRRGGHNVPKVDIRRRYRRSLRNFWEIYRFSVDTWMLYDNSGEIYVEVACGNDDNYEIIRSNSMQNFLTEVEVG